MYPPGSVSSVALVGWTVLVRIEATGNVPRLGRLKTRPATLSQGDARTVIIVPLVLSYHI